MEIKKLYRLFLKIKIISKKVLQHLNQILEDHLRFRSASNQVNRSSTSQINPNFSQANKNKSFENKNKKNY